MERAIAAMEAMVLKEAELDEFLAIRDGAIRDAHRAGLGYDRLAAAVKLSKTSVANICRAT